MYCYLWFPSLGPDISPPWILIPIVLLAGKLISDGGRSLPPPLPSLLSKEISITPSTDQVKNTFPPFSPTWPWVFILALFPWQLDKGGRVSLLPSNSTLGDEKPWSIYRSIWIGSLSVNYKYVAGARISRLHSGDSSLTEHRAWCGTWE